MSVTTTTYTTNSKQITISNETGPINIMSAVDTAITGLGWAQYDYIAAGASTVVNGIANTWSIQNIIFKLVIANFLREFSNTVASLVTHEVSSIVADATTRSPS